jgi:HK97 family phage major capsid protein
VRQGEIRRALHEHLRRDSDQRAFNLTETLLAISERRRVTGFEGEILELADGNRGSRGQYMDTSVLPFALLEHLATRDMTVGTNSAGGYLVQSPAKPQGLVAFDGSVSARLGVNIEPGNTATLALPRATGTLPVTWLTNEGTSASEQTPTIAQVTSSPKTACSVVDVSVRLLRQGQSMDRFMTALLLQAAHSALDTAVFGGSGASGQPTGLMNNTEIQTVSGTTFDNGAAASAKKKIADYLVDDFNAKWLASTDAREILEKRVRTGSSSAPVWDGDYMLGRLALASNRMPAASLVYGDFSQVYAPVWGAGIELALDPFTQFKEGFVTFRVLLTLDVLVPQPTALVRTNTTLT